MSSKTDQSATAPPRSKILVADDSKLVRMTAEKFLSEQFDLVLVNDGEEAWSEIETDPDIQAVFTDLGMPRLDGYGLIRRVRESAEERIRNLPMIVITGASEEESVRREAFDVGATDFVTKPFKSTTLLARADAHTSYRKLHHTLRENSQLDPETGLLDGKGIRKQLEKDLSFVTRHTENLALVIFELDNFDAIQAKIGRKTATAIIQEVVKSVSGILRKEDSVGREGLARFTASLPMAKPDGVVKMARRLCERVASFSLKAKGEPIPLSLSAGIASMGRQDKPRVEELVKCAEQALNNARSLGPGEVQLLKLEIEYDNEAEALSIDELLAELARGGSDNIVPELDRVVETLTPLIALLNTKQRNRLLTSAS